jgi:muramoyltetrapeptide carboxypeptidase
MDSLSGKPIRPPRLKAGDTIGVVAPAGPFERRLFSQGVSALESMGFQIRVPDEIFEKAGYLAGDDAHRARLVNRLFEDPGIDAIICARGGFGSMRILPRLDFDAIRKNPKIFMGFSDITALLTAITQRGGLVSFHSPVVTTLAGALKNTRNSLLAAVSSATPLEVRAASGIVIQAGRAQGPVIGGNLATLCHLLGTPYQPGFKNYILLLEDQGEALYRIDRMVFQMKLAGCFEGIAGLVLGSFEGCGSIKGVFRVVEEHFRDISGPILAGFDVGHGKQNLTVPFGLNATLDAAKHMLSFDEPATIG